MGNLPGSPTAIVQPSSVKLSNRQLPLWALKTFSPSTMARLVPAVLKEFVMTAEDTRFVAEFIDSLFPVMREGYNFDASVSNADSPVSLQRQAPRSCMPAIPYPSRSPWQSGRAPNGCHDRFPRDERRRLGQPG
jgi:hypothetical protein